MTRGNLKLSLRQKNVDLISQESYTRLRDGGFFKGLVFCPLILTKRALFVQ
jgi:hypothetical protein